MKLIAFAVLFLSAALTFAGPVQLNSARVTELPDGSQVSLDLNSSVEYATFLLDHPPRLVVDLSGASLAPAIKNAQLSSPDIRALRIGIRGGVGLRIVMDLAALMRSETRLVKSTDSQGYQLLLDVYRKQKPASLGAIQTNASSSRRGATADPVPVAPRPKAAVMETNPLPVATPKQPPPSAGATAMPAKTAPPPREPLLSKTVSFVSTPRSPITLPAEPAVVSKPVSASLAVSSANQAAVAKAPAPVVTASRAPAPSSPARRQRDIVVVIDPGHGGKDPGAVGAGQTQEKDVVLQIAKRVQALINQKPGIRAVLTRQGDTYLQLYERIEIARRYKGNLFVSVHADAAYNNVDASGSSVFMLSNKGATSAAARWLAKKENDADLIGGGNIQNVDDELKPVVFDILHDAVLAESMVLSEQMLRELRKVGNVHKGSVERAGFAVLKAPDMPSVLVETAFISNPAEERKLSDSRQQQLLATAIVNGVFAYLRQRPQQRNLMVTGADLETPRSRIAQR